MKIANIVSQNEYQGSKIHPKKYALLVACASILMMFAAFTSAYLVRKGGGNWLEFELPSLFFYNTGVMLLSGVVLHFSVFWFKKNKFKQFAYLMATALGLGLLFILLQYGAWQQLIAKGIELTTNPSSSFIYVISGLHALHVLGGIVAMAVTYTSLLVSRKERTSTKSLGLELTLYYWHFVDFLWLYLLGFWLLQ